MTEKTDKTETLLTISVEDALQAVILLYKELKAEKDQLHDLYNTVTSQKNEMLRDIDLISSIIKSDHECNSKISNHDYNETMRIRRKLGIDEGLNIPEEVKPSTCPVVEGSTLLGLGYR